MVEQLLTFGSRYRLLSFLLVIAFTAVAAGGLIQLKVDTSYDSLISESDPGRPAYLATIEEFGSDNTTIIYLKDEKLFSSERLTQLEDLTYALQEIESVESVESLFTVLNIRDEEGMLESGPLMDYVPEEEDEIRRVRDNATYSPLIRGNFLSEDGTVTALTVTVRRDRTDPKFNIALFDAIESLITPLRTDFDEVFQIGPPRLNVEIERGMFADMQFLSPISTALLIGMIIFFLRTATAAIIPLATSGISVLWTFGFMGYLGLPITLLTAIVPSLVIVIGSTEDTHMLASYLHGVKENQPVDRRRAIFFMARHVGLPIFITSFTTAVGFLTNALNDIPLIQGFAYATSFAMFANLVSTILIVPLILSLVGPKTSKLAPSDQRPSGVIGKLVGVLETVAERYEKPVLVVTGLFLLVFGYLSFTVNVSNDPLSYFKSSNPLVQDSAKLHRDLAGMQLFYLTLESDQPDAFKTPELLEQLEKVDRFMESQSGYDKVISLADYLALVNREMQQGSADTYHVPGSRDLIEQYLLLFQRSDIERYISHDFRRANIIVRHNLSDSHLLNAKIRALTEELDAGLGEGLSYRFSGENLMINRAAESLFSGQISSLLLLLAIIFVIMALLFTSLSAGFLSLLPNSIPVVLNFGVMGLLGIPLNPGTATVAVIAVGIAVDDTIHFLMRYNDECKKDADQARAIRATLWTESVPVVSTSISLAAGFAVLLFSNFAIVAQFGALAAATMLYAMIADLLVTPLVLKHMRLAGIWEIVGLKVGREVLLNSPLFTNMTPYEIKKAIVLSQVRTYAPGEEIVTQESHGRSMFLMLSGSVDVMHEAGERSHRTIGTLTPGQVFGEVGFALDAERTASVVAREDVELLELDFESTGRALRFSPRIAAKLYLNISRVLGERLAITLDPESPAAASDATE